MGAQQVDRTAQGHHGLSPVSHPSGHSRLWQAEDGTQLGSPDLSSYLRSTYADGASLEELARSAGQVRLRRARAEAEVQDEPRDLCALPSG